MVTSCPEEYLLLTLARTRKSVDWVTEKHEVADGIFYQRNGKCLSIQVPVIHWPIWACNGCHYNPHLLLIPRTIHDRWQRTFHFPPLQCTVLSLLKILKSLSTKWEKQFYMTKKCVVIGVVILWSLKFCVLIWIVCINVKSWVCHCVHGPQNDGLRAADGLQPTGHTVGNGFSYLIHLLIRLYYQLSV